MELQWLTHQLAEYFAAVRSPQDEVVLVDAAVAHTAKALGADVCAVTVDGAVPACIGLEPGPARDALLDASAEAESLFVPGRGAMSAVVAELSGHGRGTLIVARSGEPYRKEERWLVQGMAQALGMALRSLRTMATERALREDRAREADERIRLLDAVRTRQRLLDTLLNIQHAIADGKDLRYLLDAVTAGAADLLGNAATTLLTLVRESGQVSFTVASSCGPAERTGDDLVLETARTSLETRRTAAQTGLGNAEEYQRVIATPVYVRGEIVAIFAAHTVGGLDRTIEEHELIDAFAQQAGAALTEARTRAAMHAAHHDPLTGLPVRALFLEHLEQAMTNERGEAGSVTVLLVDLDRFKSVNDGLGHATADAVLVEFNHRLRGCLRADDTAARLGGDEFGVLLRGASATTGIRAARAIMDSVTEPFRIAGRIIRLTASVGVASSDASVGYAGEAGDLLTRADVALGHAKRIGGANVVVFEPHMQTAIRERLNLQDDLRRALGLTEFRLQYQPLIDLDGNRPVGVEALVRWHHPERGNVPPNAFIPLAEETGLITELGLWILREAVSQLASWRSTIPDMRLNVNVSARQTLDPEFVTDVAKSLADANLPGTVLTLELTESVLMDDPDLALVQLRQLKNLGVRLSIDDFGTGYSSLSYLRQFPVDQLKIDRSFVSGITTDKDQLAVTSTVMQLGRTLRLETVAEGIEDADQLAVLHDLGCDLGQGFHLARPMDPDAVHAFFTSHR